MAAEHMTPARGADQRYTGYTLTLTKVTEAALVTHLTAFLPQTPVWGLLEGLAAACWLRGQADGTVHLYGLAADRQTPHPMTSTAHDLIAQWPVGRVFTAHAEWRWRRGRDGVFAVLGLAETAALLLTGQQTLSDTQATTPLNGAWRVTPCTQHLIGSIIDESAQALAAQSWREVRNPYPLVYPAAHNGNRQRQPRLQGYRYATPTGVVRFTRFSQVTTLEITEGAGR